MAGALALAAQGPRTDQPESGRRCSTGAGWPDVGRGFHTWAGKDHAEIVALQEAGTWRAAPPFTSRSSRALM